MSTKIDWSGWPAAYDRVILDEIDSTMTEAARRAPSLTRPTWILALRQTEARGRRGRAWSNPDGNFSATLVMRPNGPPDQAALRSFVASMALYETLAKVVDPAKLSLKWPNDVLLNGGKVAGILLEASGQGTGTDWLSVGVGINLQTAPRPAEVEARALPPVALADHTPAQLPPEGVLFELACAFERWETSFRTYGFDPLRQSWLRHAARLGQPIIARTGNSQVEGIFDTVDIAGNLILTTAQGRQAIAAADVYFQGEG
ncbi:biotin--[acetyl-CoA-carboxylase] ligase [Actibacterium sp. XHP0104]|uniref:biotin--[acetyl-CoA-carboxylase] ligase n=1 Tax=Actibacterium sp. XHP0104 TaxID=2984335 RepID=UPI0021E99B25|nr:biotin--[acetyl-CoA-carboxylase] ligase [Actibacterium sp. XHP0104]MCV2880701.1 biotin--[acetyl-CoA-carboxylase] ligase [Actibacterium sp. XHP0104]